MRRNSRGGTRLVRLGDRRILAEGLPVNVWSDLHHHAMTVRWPAFFAAFALGFVTINLVFASLYSLGDDPIANAKPGDFLDYFFFSVETIATVGYGDMHPRTIYGHVLATLATISGVSYLAVTTGLIFARFSQPRARLLFARNPVVTTHDGARVLMIRIANARQNAIAEASAKLWLIRTETTAEGASYRKFRQLPLTRDENPVFALTWTIMHVIDEDSPLHGFGAAEAAESDAAFVVTLNGYDETSSIAVHGRWNYAAADVVLDRDYADIIFPGEGGLMRIDYSRFHDTVAAPHDSAPGVHS